MTHQEWLECTDPIKMLAFLDGKANNRKLRLFAVACCRSIWHLLSHKTSREAVEVAERHSDGLVSDEELWIAHDAAQYHAIMVTKHMDYAEETATLAASPQVFRRHKGFASGLNAVWVAESAMRAAGDEAQAAAQVDLLRCIFGPHPFEAFGIDPSWLTHAAVSLALAIYADRTFERLSSLANLLEEAGCDNEGILSHCREPGPHVKGCWVVDLMLGKK